ncbi:NUDIX hydrolase [Arthrobacter sp. Ld5]|uniref:NUDIX hydrolase n=1 Tax=Arthrobacter sp. Ld5 TaxID=649152 RepID=UPI003EBA0DA8
MSRDDEWWDLLNNEGTPIGHTFRRGGEGWPEGCFHLVAAVCVQREDGAVLLTQRSADREFPLGWEFPGGSALAGESSRSAASRELREESGLEIEASGLTLIGRFTETAAFLDFYLARVPRDAETTLQHSEVRAAEWVRPREVERRLGAGMMADPWVARLDSLWSPTKRALSTEH